MKKILPLLVLVVLLSFNSTSKNKTEHPDSFLKKIDTSSVEINCDSLINAYKPKSYSRDSIIDLVIAQSNSSLPQGNIDLLLALKRNDSHDFTFKHPLSAVFEGVLDKAFIISNYKIIKEGNSYKEIYLESKSIPTLDSLSRLMENYYKQIYFTDIINELSEEDKTIYVIGTKSVDKAEIIDLGKDNNECEPYLFYNFSSNTSNDTSIPLIASPFQIEVVYGNWPDVDALVYNPLMECVDCPDSYDKTKTFAKLKGTKNVYLFYNGISPFSDDDYTPSRSLVYLSENNELITFWSDSIDMFGCGCL